MNKYVIMGVQGCGKGTQAKLLEEDFDLVHISVGDIFRSSIQKHTKLGARIKRLISSGRLVDDDIVEEIVQRRLQEHDWNYGFVLDGFPRNNRQAEFFLESYDIDAVIRMIVPDAVVRERVLARRLCSECGLDYNLIFHRPQVEDCCDVCGGKLVQRADDNQQALTERLQTYHTKTAPVINLFRRKELIVEVDGTKSIEVIQNEIRDALRLPVYTPPQRQALPQGDKCFAANPA